MTTLPEVADDELILALDAIAQDAEMPFVDMSNAPRGTILLDGHFTIDQLKLIIDYLKAVKP